MDHNADLMHCLQLTASKEVKQTGETQPMDSAENSQQISSPNMNPTATGQPTPFPVHATLLEAIPKPHIQTKNQIPTPAEIVNNAIPQTPVGDIQQCEELK